MQAFTFFELLLTICLLPEEIYIEPYGFNFFSGGGGGGGSRVLDYIVLHIAFVLLKDLPPDKCS